MTSYEPPPSTSNVGGTAPGTTPGTAGGTTPPAKKRGAGISSALSSLLIIALTVILVLFVVFNTQTVQVSLVFVNVDLPLVLALLAAAVLGGLIAALVSFRSRRRHR